MRTEILLDVQGMSCAGCAGRVQKLLSAQPGVSRAEVNLVSKTARIDHRRGLAAAQDLARVVSAGGYPATVKETDEVRIDDPQAEIREVGRRALIATLLATPVFLMEMGGHLIPALGHALHDGIGTTTLWWIECALTTLILLWPGAGFFTHGVPALLRRAPDMNSLVALGTGAAWSYSCVVLLAPTLLPDTARAVYFEAAAVIVALVLIGRWLEARARGRTGAAIRALVALRPETAWRREGDAWREVALDMVQVGDLLQVRAGAQVPVDGEVLTGSSHVDESMITGEPLPVSRGPGDALVGGTINGAGTLEMRTTAVGQDTVLARIITTVQAAQDAKLPVQALADRVVLIFVPVILAIAALTLLGWLVFSGDVTRALVAAVSVLIIACPCAMGLATPTAIMVGTGRAAEMGVLFRKGDALQRLDEARIVAFDKTGTLTRGHPVVTQVIAAEGWTSQTLTRLAAAAESGSDHPIARAIIAAAEAPLPEARGSQARAGFGLMAEVEGARVLIGAPRLMRDEGVEIPEALQRQADAQAASGASLVFVAVDGVLAGLIAVADEVKDNVPAALKGLRAAGLELAMVTGDMQATAAHVAKALGIGTVLAEVLPDGKAAAVDRLRDDHGAVVFVGDGINDGPALAAADVGIAMGGGTDVAIEAADVVLVGDDPAGVLTALSLSKKTMRTIRQNLFWAFAYNVALIPVAALGLISPVLAAGAMALSSVFVVGNALRLRRAK